MRVNVYAEEMTNRVEIITKEVDGVKFTGLRFYLELPVTIPLPHGGHTTHQGPFIPNPGDDDSAAVTFWGKSDFRHVLRQALELLDDYYAGREMAQLRAGASFPPPGEKKEKQ